MHFYFIFSSLTNKTIKMFYWHHFVQPCNANRSKSPKCDPTVSAVSSVIMQNHTFKSSATLTNLATNMHTSTSKVKVKSVCTKVNHIIIRCNEMCCSQPAFSSRRLKLTLAQRFISLTKDKREFIQA